MLTQLIRSAVASITEFPGAVQLNANTQVKIDGPIGTYSTDTINRAGWVGNQYFLDVTGEGGNQLHAILEFYFFMSSEELAADFYVVRIMSKTTPNPDDSNWLLDSGGVDDPNGPANKVHVNVTRGAIRWDWCIPWDYVEYTLDKVVTVTETYSVSASVEGALYAFSGEGQYSFYVSVYWSGGGGCPILYVYNGTEYISEGLLDIHNPDGIDVVHNHTLAITPQPVEGAYLFRLVEHPQTHSYIDQVKLYAILEDKTVVELPLIWAWHSEEGNVLPQLLFSDDWKTDTLGANLNNGTSQSINLKFAALKPNMPVIGFIFQIEGNNVIVKV